MRNIKYHLNILEKEVGLMITLRKYMFDDQNELTQFGHDFIDICLKHHVPIKTIKALYGKDIDIVKKKYRS